MGNAMDESTSKYILDEKTLQYLEMQMLLCSGLPRDQIQQKDVKVGHFEGQDVTIRTIILGDPSAFSSKQTLVLVHGYAGSGALFYKMFKELTQHFRLIVIDIIGMGSSSRPTNYDRKTITPQESVDYFVDYLEKWRKVMRLTTFVLAGHSFGGYIVGNYALRHHEYVTKLILISPIGIRQEPEGENWEERFERKVRQAGQGPPRWVKPSVKLVWLTKLSPFTVGRFLGQRQTVKMLQNYVASRHKSTTEDEKQAIVNYMY